MGVRFKKVQIETLQLFLLLLLCTTTERLTVNNLFESQSQEWDVLTCSRFLPKDLKTIKICYVCVAMKVIGACITIRVLHRNILNFFIIC